MSLEPVLVDCRYRLIVKYKTAFYSFYLPVAAAMVQTYVPADPVQFPGCHPCFIVTAPPTRCLCLRLQQRHHRRCQLHRGM
jgi:hypothetical protein